METFDCFIFNKIFGVWYGRGVKVVSALWDDAIINVLWSQEMSEWGKEHLVKYQIKTKYS